MLCWFQAALITNKFNLAMTLIRKARDAAQLKTVNKDSANLFHILCHKAQGNTQLELQLRVRDCVRYLWSYVSKEDISTLVSDWMIMLCCHVHRLPTC